MSIKKGLGRGLSALFSVYDEDESDVTMQNRSQPINNGDEVVNQIQGVSEVNIEKIKINPNQPRKIFDETALSELAESIKQHGVIQPIIVNRQDDGCFLIIAGERRFRASKLAGLQTIPCIIKNYTERQIREVALIENLQREDLNPIEAARAIKQLMEEYNFTQETVADRIGKSRPNVTNLLRLLKLTPEVILMIEKGMLSAGHARTLVVVEDKNLQVKLAKTMIDKKMSVREAEKLVKAFTKPRKTRLVKPDEQSPELIEFSEEMERIFSTKVFILGNDNKGKICIEYFSRDDLDRIYEMLKLIKNKTLTLQDLKNFNTKH